VREGDISNDDRGDIQYELSVTHLSLTFNMSVIYYIIYSMFSIYLGIRRYWKSECMAWHGMAYGSIAYDVNRKEKKIFAS